MCRKIFSDLDQGSPKFIFFANQTAIVDHLFAHNCSPYLPKRSQMIVQIIWFGSNDWRIMISLCLTCVLQQDLSFYFAHFYRQFLGIFFLLNWSYIVPYFKSQPKIVRAKNFESENSCTKIYENHEILLTDRFDVQPFQKRSYFKL